MRFVERDARSVPPAALAAFAESAIWFIPLSVLAVDTVGVTTGPLDSYPLLVLLFTASAAAATWLRHSPWLPGFLVAGGIVAGALQVAASEGGHGAPAVVGSVVLMLVVAARVLTMALRDWRNPVAEAFGLGAAVLLAEIVLSAGSNRIDRGILPAMVVQFYLGSVASRAASVRLAAPTGHARSGARRLKVAGISVAALAVVLLAGLVVGRRGSVLEALGEAVLALIIPVVSFLAFVVARVLIGPIDWIFGRLDISLQPLQDLASFLTGPRVQQQQPTGSGWVLRVIGLVALVLLGLLLIRIIRRLWAPEGYEGTARPEAVLDARVVSGPRRRRRGSRPRFELPADTVRRWYAEALIILDRKGLRKPPSWTPGEYLAEVRRTFPECAPAFTRLTRSYEEVRYGSRIFGKDALDRLETHRVHLMDVLKRERGGPTSDDRDQA